MKGISTKIVKILMLISMIFSSLQTPIYVLADELSDNTTTSSVTPEKGDMKLGTDGEITKEGYITVTSKSTDEKIEVKKTVTADETTEGKYKVDFEITGKESENEAPVYVVIVFDTSGSMCRRSNSSNYCDNMDKWNNAVSAVQSFAKTIIDDLPKSKVALVTFAKNGNQKRTFEHKYLGSSTDTTLFGSPNGGTNLHDGLLKANDYLTNNIAEADKATAKKYVVVMSDGQPTYYNNGGNGRTTTKEVLDATLSASQTIKNSGTQIYSIGYALPSGDVYNDRYTFDGTTYNGLTAKEILQLVASTDTAEDIENNTQHYQDAESEDKIVEVFKKIAKSITLAGKNATLTDNIGSNFKFISTNATTSDGKTTIGGTSIPSANGFGGNYVSNQITEITEDKITISFNIEINKDAQTGWHQTNAGFKLEYTDSEGNKQTITCNEDPYVYWVQAKYDYVVNYYKDSITESNLLATETRQAPAGTIINETNVDKNKYLSTAGVSYEYNSITPETITITNDGETKVINILYVKVYGDLTVKHVDTNGVDLLIPVKTTKEVGTSYTTGAENIYGYTLTNTPTNANGSYTKEPIIVTYVYTKNEGKVENVETNEVIKSQTNTIIGVNSTFKYTLTYKGIVKDYIGSATVTLKDTLPYEVSSIKYDEGCSYNEETRLLTCTKTVNLDENNQTIDATFNIEVTYKNLTGTTNLDVLNKVESTLTFGETSVEDESEVTDTVKSGSVTAVYVDEAGNTLADSVTTTGLVDTDYETNEKTIYGYTLDRVEGNETGKYTEEAITVTYVYTKNEGTTETNEVKKVGPTNVTSVNGVFNYTLTYTGKIKDYVGIATLTLKDILPYEIDEELSTYEGCTYENKVLTCTKEYNIDKNNQDVTAEFNLSLVFKNVDSDKVTNKVESTLDYGKTPDKDTDETETEVFKGIVIATYKNEQGETLNENISQEGLAGSEYETKALEFLGYTLIETPENQNGSYIANETIYVNYIYSKNVGTSEEMLEKQGPQKVIDINSPFEYKITYNIEIFDYVGDVKITLTDILPYEIDEEKSILGDTCKYMDGNLVCGYLKTITNKDNSKISIEENLILYYKNINSNQVTNRVVASVVYGEEEIIDEDEYTTEIPYGTLVVNYITDDGKTLSPSIVTTELVGTSYTTEAGIFDNYYLKEVIGETSGLYAEEKTEVTYVYSLIPLPPQTGVENNSVNYIGLLIFAALVLVLKRRYL